MTKVNGWANHEDTFEENLRRELLAERAKVFLLQKDIKEITSSYYKILKENKTLKTAKDESSK
jgi:hypothetical protein